MSLRLYFVSLAAMMENKFGQCRRHTSFPDSISRIQIMHVHVTGQGVSYF